MVNELSSSFEKLATYIRTEHKAAQAAVERGARHAKNAGEALLKVWKKLKHGERAQWLAIHCEISMRTATNYMRIAKRWTEIEANWQSVAELSQAKALQIISKASPKVVEFIPPSQDNTREAFEAVAARGQAILEPRDAFSLEALPVEEHDVITRGQAVLANQAKPGGLTWMREQAASLAANLRRPAPTGAYASTSARPLDTYAAITRATAALDALCDELEHLTPAQIVAALDPLTLSGVAADAERASAWLDEIAVVAAEATARKSGAGQ